MQLPVNIWTPLDIETIRTDEDIRDAFVECYTLQIMISENGMNVTPDMLQEWDRIEGTLIHTILARGASLDREDFINAVRLAFTKRYPGETTPQLWDTMRGAMLDAFQKAGTQENQCDGAEHRTGYRRGRDGYATKRGY